MFIESRRQAHEVLRDLYSHTHALQKMDRREFVETIQEHAFDLGVLDGKAQAILGTPSLFSWVADPSLANFSDEKQQDFYDRWYVRCVERVVARLEAYTARYNIPFTFQGA